MAIACNSMVFHIEAFCQLLLPRFSDSATNVEGAAKRACFAGLWVGEPRGGYSHGFSGGEKTGGGVMRTDHCRETLTAGPGTGHPRVGSPRLRRDCQGDRLRGVTSRWSSAAMRRAQKPCVVPLRAAGLRFKAKKAWKRLYARKATSRKHSMALGSCLKT